MASLGVSDICKSFGTTTVLDHVHLDIRDGEFLSLVGPSGCGKTTLLRIIAGLDHADSGSVSIAGAPVDQLPPKRRDVAMVFQSYALYPYMTVGGNLSLPLVMRRLSRWQRMPLAGRFWPGSARVRQAITAAVAEVASLLGLSGLLDRRPAQLSGGQRQRVALGRAMVRQPQVFLMDEPLSNLDAKLRAATRTEIAELHRRLQATFVYVTHDQVEAMTMSDRVAMMMDGRILQLATPQEIYDDPCELRVAEFIGTPRINTLGATRSGDALLVGGQRWPLAVPGDDGRQLTVAIRPEWWTIRDTGLAGDDARCVASGQVRHLELLGSQTLVHVSVDGHPQGLVATVEPERARGLRIGAAIALAAPDRRVLVFDAAGVRVRLPAPSARQPRALADG
jgi:multiple sugar transport system ATP-binding protein